MTEKELQNIDALIDFLHFYKLKKSGELSCTFPALVTIETENNKLTDEKYKIHITWSGYNITGLVEIFDNDLDPDTYPTSFDVKWQDFKNADNKYLLISGFHDKNPKIGKYTVKIIPLLNDAK